MSPRSYDTLGHRFIVVFIIIVLALLLLSFCSWLSGRWDDAAAQEVVSSSPYDAEILALERQAIDKAFADQIGLLYSVWMKDPQSGPARAKVGAGHARRAYIDVRNALERRQKADGN